MEKATLEDLTGFLGVGAIEMLGVFLISDGESNLIEWIANLPGAQNLAIAGAVPLLVICYVLGVVTVTATQLCAHAVYQPAITPALFAEVTASGNDSLIRRFNEVERHSRLLYGCPLGFVMLAVGSLSEVTQLGADLAYIGYMCFAAGLCIAASCIPVSYRLQRELATWAAAVLARTRG